MAICPMTMSSCCHDDAMMQCHSNAMKIMAAIESNHQLMTTIEKSASMQAGMCQMAVSMANCNVKEQQASQAQRTEKQARWQQRRSAMVASSANNGHSQLAT